MATSVRAQAKHEVQLKYLYLAASLLHHILAGCSDVLDAHNSIMTLSNEIRLLEMATVNQLAEPPLEDKCVCSRRISGKVCTALAHGSPEGSFTDP